MTKKTKFILLIMFIIVLGGGCSPKPQQSPEEVAGSFLEALKSYDYEAIQPYTTIDPELFGNEADFTYSFFKESAAQITYEIVDWSTEGDIAYIDVNIAYVDGYELFKEIASKLIAMALSGELEDSGRYNAEKELFSQLWASYPLDINNRTITLECVQIGGQWFVRENEDLVNVLKANQYSAYQHTFGDADSLMGDASETEDAVFQTSGRDVDILELLTHNFMDALIQFDFNQISLYLEAGEAAADPADEENEYLNFYRESAGKISYEIENIKVYQDTAAVELYVRFIDGTDIYLDVYNQMLEKISNGQEGFSEEEEEAFLRDAIRSHDPVFTEKMVVLNCAQRSDGSWYVGNSPDIDDVMTANMASATANMVF